MKFASILLSIYILLVVFCCDTPVTPISESLDAQLRGVVNTVDETRFMADMYAWFNEERLPVRTSSERLIEIRDSIAASFKASGCTVSFQPVPLDADTFNQSLIAYYEMEEYPYNTETGLAHETLYMDNIIAVLPGSDPSLAPVLMSSHWDTVPFSLGAADNGTACAALLETARVLSSIPHTRDIVFVCFAFEEEGLVGSQYYTKNLTGSMPSAVVNLDVIGWTSPVQNTVALTDVVIDFPSTGNFAAVFGSSKSNTMILDAVNLAKTYIPGLPIYTLAIDSNLANNPLLQASLRSDHEAFWNRGVPALFFTDTAEMREGSPYHTRNDTIDNLDRTFVMNVVKLAAVSVLLNAQK